MFVIDLESAQNSFDFSQTAIGSVLCCDTVSAEFLNKIINIKDGSEGFEKIKRKRNINKEEKQTRSQSAEGNLRPQVRTPRTIAYEAAGKNLRHCRNSARIPNQRSLR